MISKIQEQSEILHFVREAMSRMGAALFEILSVVWKNSYKKMKITITEVLL